LREFFQKFQLRKLFQKFRETVGNRLCNIVLRQLFGGLVAFSEAPPDPSSGVNHQATGSYCARAFGIFGQRAVGTLTYSFC